MEYIIVVLLTFVVSASVAMLGCLVGVTYNFLEWITNKRFKWMYPVAGILWIIGFIPSIICFVLIFAWEFYTYVTVWYHYTQRVG